MHTPRNRTPRQVLSLLFVPWLTTACSDDDMQSGVQYATAQTATSAGRGSATSAGGSAEPPPPPKHWLGIQVCTGRNSNGLLETTSEETSIAGYTKTQTRVRITGVRVGSSPEHSCGPLDFESVVTSNNTSTNFTNGKQQDCTSPSGKALVASGPGGYDSDTRSQIGGVTLGKWSLNFSVNLREPEDWDAGVFSKVDVSCRFELTLM